jgi:hypothetical protein
VNDEDVQSFVKLAYLGIKLEIRQVPTDPKNWSDTTDQKRKDAALIDFGYWFFRTYLYW